jgi:hypothetical protein
MDSKNMKKYSIFLVRKDIGCGFNLKFSMLD